MRVRKKRKEKRNIIKLRTERNTNKMTGERYMYV